MIGWLWPHVETTVKFGIAIAIILWFATMTYLVFAFNDSLVKRVDSQFLALQQEHREMRDLLTSDLARFGVTLQRNTDQAVKTAETSQKTAEAARKAAELLKKLPEELK